MITDNIQRFNESIGTDGAVVQKQYTAAEIQALTIPQGVTSYVSDTEGNLWKCTSSNKVIISTQSDIESINNSLSGINNSLTQIDNQLAQKVDKVGGKELSANDFTDEDMEKLEKINLRTVTSTGSSQSTPEIYIKEQEYPNLRWATPLFFDLGDTQALISSPQTTFYDTGIVLPPNAAFFTAIRLLCSFVQSGTGQPFDDTLGWDYVDIMRKVKEDSVSYGAKEFWDYNGVERRMYFIINWNTRHIFIRTQPNITEPFWIKKAYGWTPEV